ncbi:MAG: TIGR00159 family protein [Anaerolineae bacterium]|jgi:diadenylate cyclase|nr:TIGR00159 family protein [Anaerolineae bacterium]MBT7192200.1 TIGR00159 family protein [Anaerolineae bacterium]
MGWKIQPIFIPYILVTNLLSDLLFFFERLDWLSLLDIFLVTFIFFVLLYLIRDTQAMALLRGVLFLVVFILFLTSLVNLPAFSWLINTTLPALLFAIPVLFAPEIRRALERIGRAGLIISTNNQNAEDQIEKTVSSLISATARLSARQHGALIILQRFDNLEAFIETGVRMNTIITPEILLQIFYPNTPLHDGAVIVADFRIASASAIMPLSSSGILANSPEREMGLRHRAALGISEESDALALVISEENGDISVAQSGRIIRQLSIGRLENILLTFYRPAGLTRSIGIFERYLPFLFRGKKE